MQVVRLGFQAMLCNQICLGFIAFGLVAVAGVPVVFAENGDYPVGDVSRQELFNDHPAFKSGFDAYSVDALQFALPTTLEIQVMFGTWCHDSEREVPRLLKILDALGVGDERVTLIALDWDKREPRGRARDAGVKFTPTFIFYLDGSEAGRIVERPEVSLEQDIERIVSPQP